MGIFSTYSLVEECYMCVVHTWVCISHIGFVEISMPFFMQALALSDTFLNKLGVSRENVDDTAGAAQVIHL